MISFKNLGRSGRLGNQLFQYAFLRTTAQRLGVKFYCPVWLGDKILRLNDSNERASKCVGINKEYVPFNNCGFDAPALDIVDGTNIDGFFQSEKHFDRDQVKRWYEFKDEVFVSVKEKYRSIDFTESTGIHLRFGDMKNHHKFIILPKTYYIGALSKTLRKKNIIVFSDEIVTAKEHLRGIKGNFIYIDGNKDYEDLYLMTLCCDFVCSVSTFSWWGAYLNNHLDKVVVAPTRGLRPGSPVRCSDFCCRDWIPLQPYRFILDNYYFALLKQGVLGIKKRSLVENLRSLKNFLRNRVRALIGQDYE